MSNTSSNRRQIGNVAHDIGCHNHVSFTILSHNLMSQWLTKIIRYGIDALAYCYLCYVLRGLDTQMSDVVSCEMFQHDAVIASQLDYKWLSTVQDKLSSIVLGQLFKILSHFFRGA